MINPIQCVFIADIVAGISRGSFCVGYASASSLNFLNTQIDVITVSVLLSVILIFLSVAFWFHLIDFCSSFWVVLFCFFECLIFLLEVNYCVLLYWVLDVVIFFLKPTLLMKYNWYIGKLHIFRVYHLLSLGLCTYLWYHHYNQSNKHIHCLQKSFFFFFLALWPYPAIFLWPTKFLWKICWWGFPCI